jgi:signal transduction histidine kinase
LQAQHRRAAAETRIVSGEKKVTRLRSDFLTRAVAPLGTESYEYGVFDKASMISSVELYSENGAALLKENPNFRIRDITDVQADSVEAVEKLMKAGFEVRHLEDNKICFSVSRTEYIETIHAGKIGGDADQVLWTNDPQLVAQATRIFEALWEQAVPAESKIAEWQAGLKSSVTQLIAEPKQIQEKFLEMTATAKSEVSLLLPTTLAFRREESVGEIDLIEAAALRGVKVTVISPTDSDIMKRIDRLNERLARKGRGSFELVPIPEARAQGTVTVLVVDHEASLVLEQKRPDEKEFAKAIGLAIYSTSEPSVRANVRFIERMKEVIAMAMREKALLEKETHHRRQAELLQDILTHDLRNFNQITLSSAESLRSGLDGEDAVLVDNIIRATQGASLLIDRAWELSKIISMEDALLVPVDLDDSIRRSLLLVEKARPDKSIVLAPSVASRSKVLADGLLDEVFTNLISNAVKYTEGQEVPLEIRIAEASGQSARDAKESVRYLKVSVVDHGRGIADSMKDHIFKRYQETGSGSGLGLSIVNALVVERYHGKIHVADRVPNDPTRGAIIDVWLPEA